MSCDKNPEKIKKIFNEIAPIYDKMNNLISFGTHYFIKKSIIKSLKIKQNAMIIDLCCGTGDFTHIINRIYPKAKVIGLDNSVNMIQTAREKNPKQAFIYADATDLPFEENEFDLAIISFGLRNIENRKKAISEAFRVLKTNGIFIHLDFGMHNKISEIYNCFLKQVTKFLKSNGENYEYLINSKNEYPEPDKLIEEFSQCGFKFLEKKDFIFNTISCQIMIKPSK